MLVLSRRNQQSVVVGGAPGFEALSGLRCWRSAVGASGWVSRGIRIFRFIVWKSGNESWPRAKAGAIRDKADFQKRQPTKPTTR